MLKERNHQTLMTKILAKCLSKFENERSGCLVYCLKRGGRRITISRASQRYYSAENIKNRLLL